MNDHCQMIALIGSVRIRNRVPVTFIDVSSLSLDELETSSRPSLDLRIERKIS